MSYRDDLIQRMQQDGVWNQLTGDKQAQIQRFTDEQARSYMVLWDECDMGETDAIAKIGLESLANLVSSFKMNLVEIDNTNRPKLSKAGTLLAEFVKELHSKGVDLNEIASGFAGIDYLAIINLNLLHKRL